MRLKTAASSVLYIIAKVAGKLKDPKRVVVRRLVGCGRDTNIFAEKVMRRTNVTDEAGWTMPMKVVDTRLSFLCARKSNSYILFGAATLFEHYTIIECNTPYRGSECLHRGCI